MQLFDVYSRYTIEPVSAEDCWIIDRDGNRYLDMYGGHAVISIGHSHPRFVAEVGEQLGRLAFYSNSILNPLSDQLAERLGQVSGCEDYQLFLCNSGAEAIENALKLASFRNGRGRVIAFDRAFHGRTSLAVGVTDNGKIRAPINEKEDVTFLPLNDIEQLRSVIVESVGAGGESDIAAVIIEGIQGIGGIYLPTDEFLTGMAELCRSHGIILILDEIQSGYGRSGQFFAFQQSGIRPDLITVAKGMGNGFPIGGVLIAPEFEARHGMLGTTFGGNHLACAAGLSVLNVIEEEGLIENAEQTGSYLIEKLRGMRGIGEVRGEGLMIGIDMENDAAPLRKRLLFEQKCFVGSATDSRTIRLLPPLTLTRLLADQFLERFEQAIDVENGENAEPVERFAKG